MPRSSGGAENGRVSLRLPSHEVASRRARAVVVALAPVLAVVLVFAALPAQAGRKGDHDEARAAVQAGEVLPLPTLLERLQRTHPGKVLELELERDRKAGRWIYEVKLLQADGRLLKLELDAATAQVLKVGQAGGGKDKDRDKDRDKRRHGPPEGPADEAR